ncbi:MAG: class I SAM-dependent methyltransferase [Stellaceae bacterium]
MNDNSQESLVTQQFGPRAAAYVTSATHSQGQDLARLKAMFEGSAEVRILDLGCGGGHASFAAAGSVREVVAYDLSQDMLDAVAAEATRRGLGNIRVERGAVEHLPFADASFDAVITRFSAHHWGDLGAALREARRVVKPTGRAAFIDAVSPGTPLLDTFIQAIELIRDPSHVRDYAVAEWCAQLAAAGFGITAVTPRRVPIAFGPWIERMRTPTIQADAIRALQGRMSAAVVAHFAIAADGSFELDAAMIEAVPTR